MLCSILSHSSKIIIRLQNQCSQQVPLLLSHISHFQPDGRGMGFSITKACTPPQSPRPAQGQQQSSYSGVLHGRALC